MNDHRESRETRYLATRLRRAWKERGLSLGELARRAGFADRSYFSRAFSGKQTLSLPALQSVAEVLGLNYRELLVEAGLDEETYRSRHTTRERSSGGHRLAHIDIRPILMGGLNAARELKDQGRPEEARGEIGAVERMVNSHLGGLPADREALVLWAALLLERVGIVQDVQLPHTVLSSSAKDLKAIFAIADEYDVADLQAFAYFSAGDVHFKAGDYQGAIPDYAQAAYEAPTRRLRARSLTGWAIALAHLQRFDIEPSFHSLYAEIQNLLAAGETEDFHAYIWDCDGWQRSQLWSEETLGRALVLVGELRTAEAQLETVKRHYDNSDLRLVPYVPFELSLARSRFVAACAGAFDMNEGDILQLGREAYRLAEEGYCLRTKREVENLMTRRFGFPAW